MQRSAQLPAAYVPWLVGTYNPTPANQGDKYSLTASHCELHRASSADPREHPSVFRPPPIHRSRLVVQQPAVASWRGSLGAAGIAQATGVLPGKAKGAVLNCGQAGSHRVEACRQRPLRQPTRNMERLARRRSHGVPGGVRLLVAALVLAARSPAGEMTLHRLMEGAFSRRQPLSMAYSQHLTQDVQWKWARVCHCPLSPQESSWRVPQKLLIHTCA